MRLLNYILWFAKLVGCFLLMKYFIRKQSRTYSGVDTRASFSYGLKIALCSALICAAYTLWSVTQIDAEGLTMLFNEAISENQVDNNTKAAIEKLINNAPVLFTVAQFIYCFLCGLIYMNNAAFDKAVSEFEAATSCSKAAVAGTDSYAAWYNCGVIYEVLKDHARARAYYEKAGDYPPAREGMKRITAL